MLRTGHVVECCRSCAPARRAAATAAFALRASADKPAGQPSPAIVSEAGEPNCRELDPAGRGAAAAGRAQTNGVAKGPGRLNVLALRVVLSWPRSCEVDRPVARLLVRRAPLLSCAARRPGRRHRRYQPSSCPCRRSAPRGLVHLVEWPGAPPGTPSAQHEWRVLLSRSFLPRRRRAALARRRSRPHRLRFPGQSDKEESFDTGLMQDAVAQTPGVLLGVNGHPDFLPGRGMLQQQVTAFPGPDLDEPRGLQLADHLGPGHDLNRKPNARLCQRAGKLAPTSVGFDSSLRLR